MSEEKEQRSKKYEELEFKDDFMFCKVLMNNKELCTELIEMILEKEVKALSFSESQKAIEITSDGRGIRLDVYVENEDTVYDVEMQTVKSKNLPKRSRYYQGMIDLNLIQRGEDYERLKNSFVIFICEKNPFGTHQHKYTFENLCLENPSQKLGDGASKVFITPDGESGDISPKMRDFLNFIAGNAPQSDFTLRIASEVEKVRKSEEWRNEYMTLLMRDKEKYAEGMAEGRAVERTEMLSKLIQSPVSDEIILGLGFTEEEIKDARAEFSTQTLI